MATTMIFLNYGGVCIDKILQTILLQMSIY